MTFLQKRAGFRLAAIALGWLSAFALVPELGIQRVQAGLAILALLGFGLCLDRAPTSPAVTSAAPKNCRVFLTFCNFYFTIRLSILFSTRGIESIERKEFAA